MLVGRLQGAKEGVYLEANDPETDQQMVWNWDGEWHSWAPDEYLWNWQPGAAYTEIPGEFNVAWAGSEHFGSWIKNSGVPPFFWSQPAGGKGQVRDSSP